ncbi:predicted protein [Naegleria gruberi]|uniref:Predicted protein n=1 Tax=Naegleria gruberi TaxID=5762 RepID=D2UXF8_NAEGR|nr:uncharacterized protein NAEGRDRAFT_61108 [Naegleria gruberi]EFC50277.1 predicted protein [Naegleria gruberi]|eukprot:XP_002683021.1 predicted protein [Naegleria gruberi strain NEG-M]
MTQKQSKNKVVEKLKKKGSGGNKKQENVSSGNEDPRFAIMHKDPKFLPVEAKTVISDPRLYEILDPSFTMLKKSRDASGKQKEQAVKNTLKGIYNFEKDPMAMRVAKLKQAKKEMEEEEGKDHESDYDSDDSIEDAKEMIGKKDKKPLTATDIFEGDESEEEEEEEMDFDKFLESLEGRPELENVEWNEEWEDAYDFDDEDAAVLKAVGQEVDSENIPEEQQDLWDKYVDDQKQIKMIEEGEETRRIAVMNCDWNLVDSDDLFVLFSSMCPPSGKIVGVTVYLSDFGKQQRESEAVSGPGNLFYDENDYKNLENVKKKIAELKEDSRNSRLVSRREKKNKDNIKVETEVEQAETNDEMLDPVKVREYEFKKMKYYFAVIECDSSQTATYLYNECDGFEFESTSILLDLRFIPDSLDFSEREIKSQCTSVPADYKPKQNMYSKPLKSSSVDLTWDTNNPEREVLKKDFKDVSEEALM